jgi:hypothetical protein
MIRDIGFTVGLAGTVASLSEQDSLSQRGCWSWQLRYLSFEVHRPLPGQEDMDR